MQTAPNSLQAEGQADRLDVGPLLDPALAKDLEGFRLPDFDEALITAIRSTPFVGSPLSDSVVRTDYLVAHHLPDAPPVPVRVHRPAGIDYPLPGLLTIHGGGYVIGSYEMDDALLDRWCLALGVVGVSVDYRLAPETPFPGPLEDCFAALHWAEENAQGLGIAEGHLGVYGVSAGGGLAAALTLLTRDRNVAPLAFALLDCPMLDDRQTSESLRADGLYVWTARSNEMGWRSYLGSLYGTTDVPQYAAAARATDLRGLPPMCVVVGSIDGFRDEDVRFAQRLNRAGVACELHVLAGLPHGYMLVPNAPVVQDADFCKERWLARQLDRLKG